MDHIENFSRPAFPARAVVTAGMPYGNKELHFGHIGGVFVHADIYARFLRDRLGPENVIFVSGTDCYGATIEAGYAAAREDGFDGTIEDYVSKNHQIQKDTLKDYLVSPNLYAASALGEPGAIHAALSAEIFRRLHEKGWLRLDETVQFYDREKGVFLNGRQVTGRCPIQGCKSEIAYADECALGHQYNPAELIAPKSTLSGEPPERVPVKNWFFDLPAFHKDIETTLAGWEESPLYRKSLISVVREFLRKPSVYVKKEQAEEAAGLPGMPPCTLLREEKKTSWELVFETLSDRERAVKVLEDNAVRFRSGKTLVPFRLSGNVAWGIPIPEADGVSGLTFWVWPESLWAPISFTKAALGDGAEGRAWERFWKSDDARVYQFIGEDNIYFYAIAEMGLFLALDEGYRLPVVVPNHHLLYGKTKASSSGAVKPPKAAELLNHYTPEQLRIHFMNASLQERSVGFEPGAVLGKAGAFDAVLQEGNLLTNVFNRLVRSCFYAAQKRPDGGYPAGAVRPGALLRGQQTILDYERMISEFTFDRLFELLNIYIRDANKDWSAQSKSQDPEETDQILRDTFHAVRVAATLFHPIAPTGCERIRDYLGVDERLWDWNHIFEPLTFFMEPGHTFKFLEPRVDFFDKHPSQVISE